MRRCLTTLCTAAAAAAAAGAHGRAIAGNSSAGCGLYAPDFKLAKRVRTPIDQLVMQQLDAEEVSHVMALRNVAWVSWLFPVHTLQYLTHKRYEVECIATGTLDPKKIFLQDLLRQYDFSKGHTPMPSNVSGTDCTMGAQGGLMQEEKLGIVTLNIFDNYPARLSLFERLFDRPPHATATLRIMVMDRIHWQRSNYSLGTICKSLVWGRMVHDTTNIKLDYHNHVEIDAQFNKDEDKYSKYAVRIPKYNFELEIEDTGMHLLDPRNPVTPGFMDNESVLRTFTMPTEVNYSGTGQTLGSVFRQPAFTIPAQPNVGRVAKVTEGSLFRSYVGCELLGDPISVLLADELPHVALSSLESDVEDENEPHATSHSWNDGGVKDRIQQRAILRYHNFREELRRKARADIKGDEVPR